MLEFRNMPTDRGNPVRMLDRTRAALQKPASPELPASEARPACPATVGPRSIGLAAGIHAAQTALLPWYLPICQWWPRPRAGSQHARSCPCRKRHFTL